MNASAQPLIRLDGIKKVFYTDEVETHALAGIHLEIQQGEYVAIAGPSVAASRRCWRSWGCSTPPPTALTC
jgi:predicted ABC-type transport system involved in lysophospholipase L1 biosynthesis ATPase subunit